MLVNIEKSFLDQNLTLDINAFLDAAHGDGKLLSIEAEYELESGVELGVGFGCVEHKGTQHRDEITPKGFIGNNSGGVLGGISSGQDIIVSIAIKPTSSIRLPGNTVDKSGKATEVATKGRHDPCVGIRATPIAEAMLALVIMDPVLRHRAQNADVVSETPIIPSSK